MVVHVPNSLSPTFFLFDADIEDHTASPLIPIDRTPISSTHNELLLPRLAIRIVLKEGHLCEGYMVRLSASLASPKPLFRLFHSSALFYALYWQVMTLSL